MNACDLLDDDTFLLLGCFVRSWYRQDILHSAERQGWPDLALPDTPLGCKYDYKLFCALASLDTLAVAWHALTLASLEVA